MNYEIWDLSEEFDIGDAVFLWAEVAPGSKVEVQRIRPYIQLLHSAVARDELPGRLGPRGWITSREALLAFAKKKGQTPPFLFPEERHKSTHSELEARSSLADPYKTGLAGKPSIRHFILPEFRRRVAENGNETSLAKEAQALCDWARTEHPEAPTPTARTIENLLRPEFRRLVKNAPTK